MREYSKGRIITFATVNAFMTILSIVAIILFFGLAFAFTPQEALQQNRKIFLIFSSITIVLDGLKWLAFYFIIKMGIKQWYVYYAIYLLIFTYFAFYAPILFIVPMIYFIMIMYVEK